MQDGLTGSAWGDWANYTASPLRAFENELGVQAPVGFWDPVGFTADGDVAAFKRRRSVELKHGRISMMATMGASDLIVLHFFVCFVYFSDCNNSSTSKYLECGSFVCKSDNWWICNVPSDHVLRGYITPEITGKLLRTQQLRFECLEKQMQLSWDCKDSVCSR